MQFSGVAFKREGRGRSHAEPRADTAPNRSAAVPGGRAALLLDGVMLPAGRYEWLRLIVDNAPNVRDRSWSRAAGECELACRVAPNRD